MAEEKAAQALCHHLEKAGNRATRSLGRAGGNGGGAICEITKCLNCKKNWQQFSAVHKLTPLCCKPKTKTKHQSKWGGAEHGIHTHVHTSSAHTELCSPVKGWVLLKAARVCLCVGPSESLVLIKVTEAGSAKAPGPESNSEQSGVAFLLIFIKRSWLCAKARVNLIQDPRSV